MAIPIGDTPEVEVHTLAALRQKPMLLLPCLLLLFLIRPFSSAEDSSSQCSVDDAPQFMVQSIPEQPKNKHLQCSSDDLQSCCFLVNYSPCSTFLSRRPAGPSNSPKPATDRPTSLRPLSGFQFCKHLDGSIFDVALPIYQSVFRSIIDEEATVLNHANIHIPATLDTHCATIESYGVQHYPLVVDSVARSVYSMLLSKNFFKVDMTAFISSLMHLNHSISLKSAQRFSCYMAAHGHNSWVSLKYEEIDSPLLHFVDGFNYFPSLGFLSSSSAHNDESTTGHLNPLTSASSPFFSPPSNFSKYLKHLFKQRQQPNASLLDASTARQTLNSSTKIAYLLMVHKTLLNAVNLVNALVDPLAIVLIHVDIKNQFLKESLTKHYKDHPRVRVMARSYSLLWGGSSIVLAELAGFFELLEWDSNWEYAVNMSGDDYPLQSNFRIYEDLVSFGPKKSFIHYWSSPFECIHLFVRVNAH